MAVVVDVVVSVVAREMQKESCEVQGGNQKQQGIHGDQVYGVATIFNQLQLPFEAGGSFVLNGGELSSPFVSITTMGTRRLKGLP
jgi:hypothetical protein